MQPRTYVIGPNGKTDLQILRENFTPALENYYNKVKPKYTEFAQKYIKAHKEIHCKLKELEEDAKKLGIEISLSENPLVTLEEHGPLCNFNTPCTKCWCEYAPLREFVKMIREKKDLDFALQTLYNKS